MCKLIVCSVETRSLGVALFPVAHPREHRDADLILIQTLYENKNREEMYFSHLIVIDSCIFCEKLDVGKLNTLYVHL